jgi:hypothetical protein
VRRYYWLKDFLSLQLQDAGIMNRVPSYGYDSDTAFSKAVIDIDDVAGMLLDRLVGERQSPAGQSMAITFVAHSRYPYFSSDASSDHGQGR